jgi:hypothetical protein
MKRVLTGGDDTMSVFGFPEELSSKNGPPKNPRIKDLVIGQLMYL